MTEAQSQYLLAGQRGELERLQLQARVLEPDTEAMLDLIGIQSGWHCLDLGCGAMGILGPLSRRVGTSGKVVGLDVDPKLIDAARILGQEEGWDNVELREGNALQTHLAPASFDVVHARFLLAPLWQHEAALLREMLALTRPGGVLMLQEPDVSSCTPLSSFKPVVPRPSTPERAGDAIISDAIGHVQTAQSRATPSCKPLRPAAAACRGRRHCRVRKAATSGGTGMSRWRFPGLRSGRGGIKMAL